MFLKRLRLLQSVFPFLARWAPPASLAIPTSLFIALAATGCNSPLLNHANAADLRTSSESAPELDPNLPPDPAPDACPLAFPQQGLCAELRWDANPNDQDPASFMLRFWNGSQGSATGPYQDPGLAVNVKLWMPAMGHGSSPVSLAQALDPSGLGITGTYRGGNAYFIMPGDWEVHVQLRQGTSVQEEAVLRVHI